jgi:hypothetical protein
MSLRVMSALTKLLVQIDRTSPVPMVDFSRF